MAVLAPHSFIARCFPGGAPEAVMAMAIPSGGLDKHVSLRITGVSRAFTGVSQAGIFSHSIIK